MITRTVVAKFSPEPISENSIKTFLLDTIESNYIAMVTFCENKILQADVEITNSQYY